MVVLLQLEKALLWGEPRGSSRCSNRCSAGVLQVRRTLLRHEQLKVKHFPVQVQHGGSRTAYALAPPSSEEFHPLCVVHGDDLGSAFRLQRLQRAQQHPLLQAVELWREARSEDGGLGSAACWGFQQTLSQSRHSLRLLLRF